MLFPLSKREHTPNNMRFGVVFSGFGAWWLPLGSGGWTDFRRIKPWVEKTATKKERKIVPVKALAAAPVPPVYAGWNPKSKEETKLPKTHMNEICQISLQVSTEKGAQTPSGLLYVQIIDSTEVLWHAFSVFFCQPSFFCSGHSMKTIAAFCSPTLPVLPWQSLLNRCAIQQEREPPLWDMHWPSLLRTNTATLALRTVHFPFAAEERSLDSIGNSLKSQERYDGNSPASQVHQTGLPWILVQVQLEIEAKQLAPARAQCSS